VLPKSPEQDSPDTVNVLTVNNSAGVVASSDLTISGYLELTNGLFTVHQVIA
jgi:hypothetical protein